MSVLGGFEEARKDASKIYFWRVDREQMAISTLFSSSFSGLSVMPDV
jgi:hypothetical protein